MKNFKLTLMISCLGFSAISIVMYGFPTGLILGVLTGVIFAFLFSLASDVYLQMKYTNGNVPSVNQQLNLTLTGTFDEIFELCKNSLKKLKLGKIIKLDKLNGEIVAKTGFNLLFWRIDIIHVSKINSSTVNIQVSSRPLFIFNRSDGGENLQNLVRIREILNKAKNS